MKDFFTKKIDVNACILCGADKSKEKKTGATLLKELSTKSKNQIFPMR